MKNIPKKLSIIILNYRTPEQTIYAINSIENTSKDTYHEIIVVDNASSDGSVDTIELRCPNVRIIRLKKNMGFAAGMNAGIKESSGDYVLLLNSDIEVIEGTIPEMVSFFGDNPEVGICAPAMVDDNGNMSRSLLNVPKFWRVIFPSIGKYAYKKQVKRIGKEPLEVEAVEGSAIMLPRRVLDTVGLLDEDFFFYHEIVEWCMRIREHGYKVCLLPQVAMKHLCGGSTKKEIWTVAKIELKRTEYTLIKKKFGRGLFYTLYLKDIMCELVSVILYGLMGITSFGLLRNARTKFSVHGALLLWLVLGLRDRHDPLFIKLFGRWE